MSDDEPDRNSFEDIARMLTEEVSRAVERLSQIDVDELSRTANAEAERARHWVDDLGRWLREQSDAVGSAAFGAAEAWDTRSPADRPALRSGSSPGRLGAGRSAGDLVSHASAAPNAALPTASLCSRSQRPRSSTQ